ncbi:MAG: flagellar basal body rod protein FlgB [Oscillospiraceae bacterium]|nr:flagellar basal body rod protein FlgB [Oscillospiraceae bacterium]
MALFDTTAFRILEQGAAVMWQKQQVIQQNIVNQDTPNYNCKYLDFGGILKEKLRANGSIKKELNLVTQLRIDKLTSDQGDRNNVDNDVEQAEMLRTQYQLEAIINQMNGNFTRIRSAIVTK